MHYGQLRLNAIALAVVEQARVRQVFVNGHIETFHQQDQRVVIDLDKPMSIHADQTAEIRLILDEG